MVTVRPRFFILFIEKARYPFFKKNCIRIASSPATTHAARYILVVNLCTALGKGEYKGSLNMAPIPPECRCLSPWLCELSIPVPKPTPRLIVLKFFAYFYLFIASLCIKTYAINFQNASRELRTPLQQVPPCTLNSWLETKNCPKYSNFPSEIYIFSETPRTGCWQPSRLPRTCRYI